MELIIQGDLKQQINTLNELAEKLEKIENQTQKLQFITIKEFAKITNWSISTVQQLFNRPDFPSCDYGKQKIAEVNAVKEYFKVPRRK